MLPECDIYSDFFIKWRRQTTLLPSATDDDNCELHRTWVTFKAISFATVYDSNISDFYIIHQILLASISLCTLNNEYKIMRAISLSVVTELKDCSAFKVTVSHTVSHVR